MSRHWLKVVLGLALVPLAAGRVIVTYQDALMTHLPSKAATVEQIRGGFFPFVNPYASCGQPLAGNPNFGTFFPDLLLFLALPLHVAFGLRFALALVLGFVGARRWARAEGVSREAADVAGFAFVLSGVFVSGWRFFNSGLALAVAPWVLAAVVRLLGRLEPGGPPVRRAVAEVGLWVGLEVLAGEPVIALLTFAIAGLRTVTQLGRAGLVRAGVVAAGGALGLLLAGPQIATTLQSYRGSSRDSAPFAFWIAAANSVHPVRFLEQVTPYPYGRPDLTGALGFSGHRRFDNHIPYLWTLHLGWVSLGLLALCGRPRAPGERFWWGMAAAAIVLSFGRHLPLARFLHPVFSLGGRVRFPVKWWYVVALCLVPLVALAAERWAAPARTLPRRRAVVAGAGILVCLGLAVTQPSTPLVLAALVASAGGVALLVAARPSGRLLAAIVALPLLACDLPLFLTFLDRPPAAPSALPGGRIFERVRAADAHPPPAPGPRAEQRTREVFRRVGPEMWALAGGVKGVGYAFDRDPDGSYLEGDRLVRKEIEDLPWEQRGVALRLAGVGHVVTDHPLSTAYRPVRPLGDQGAVLYALADPAPSVRVATRVFSAADLPDAIGHYQRPDFDVRTDTVLVGQPTPALPEAASRADLSGLRETATRLKVRVSSPVEAVLVWSRTAFPAWRARVDGQVVEVLAADGHLVGIRVPAGAHEVEVWWPHAYLVAGALSWLAGMVVLFVLRRTAP